MDDLRAILYTLVWGLVLVALFALIIFWPFILPLLKGN